MKKRLSLAAFCSSVSSEMRNQIQLTLNLTAGFYIVKLVDVFGQSSTSKIREKKKQY